MACWIDQINGVVSYIAVAIVTLRICEIWDNGVRSDPSVRVCREVSYDFWVRFIERREETAVCSLFCLSACLVAAYWQEVNSKLPDY